MYIDILPASASRVSRELPMILTSMGEQSEFVCVLCDLTISLSTLRMRRAKLQALDAINSLCLDVHRDEDNVSAVLETLGENPNLNVITDVQPTDEFETAEDDIYTVLNETLLCDIDDQNICDEDSDYDLIVSAGDFDESMQSYIAIRIAMDNIERIDTS